MMSASTHPIGSPHRAVAPRRTVRRALVGLLSVAMTMPAYPTVEVADAPVFAAPNVPGNVALALSVEWPTASRYSHADSNYASSQEYLGYFDTEKCYIYRESTTQPVQSIQHFAPNGNATNRQCTGSGQWSGNFLNWATMTTIDPFRSVLTGGHRVVDTNDGLTILQRTWRDPQGETRSPDRNVPAAEIAGATPFTWSGMRIRIHDQGFGMLFRSDTGTDAFSTSPTVYTGTQTATGTYSAFVRVRVCDSTTAGAGRLEPNCTQFGNFFKPTGLMHEYSDRMRFATFGYLNIAGDGRDGGVLRSRMKFVGPTFNIPGRSTVNNPNREWDPATGVFVSNPDPTDASSTNANFGTITRSGAMNYINQFGQILTGPYKSRDPVNELYYATLRYFRGPNNPGGGNVPEWSNPPATDGARAADAFPVITDWNDPMVWGPPNGTAQSYACQRNFVLGIGDINTHADKNVPGDATETQLEPTKPDAVRNDRTVDSVLRTNQVGVLQGLGNSFATTVTGSNQAQLSSRSYMAGLAYDANVSDIRTDLAGRQSVSTFWVDVLEGSGGANDPFVANNKYYLAAKYGGFAVPDGYVFGQALEDGWWTTTNDTLTQPSTGTVQRRPDNYFTGARPDQVRDGLRAAFRSIDSQSQQVNTSAATALPSVDTDTASFVGSYDPSNWTGDVQASTLTFDESGNVSRTSAWRFSARIAAQIGTGYQNTGWGTSNTVGTSRRIATWNTGNGTPVAFQFGSLSTAQRTALDPAFTAAADGEDLLNYLRGQRLHERGAPSGIGSQSKFRARPTVTGAIPSFVGDISGSRLLVVDPPNLRLADTSNPGYSTFKANWASRPRMVYFGSNDGFLRGVRGDLDGASAGLEVFAYVPGALFNGPSGTPQVNGLVGLANPNFVHHNYVNATPVVSDMDLARTLANGDTAAAQVAANPTPNWASVLIGGLGSGGRSYFALNVTDPAGITTEAAAVNRVMWEFTDSRLGLSFGQAVVVKTRRHGWVAVLPSGYNNADGRGYFLIVNPRNGQLIQAVDTGVGTPTNQAGLAHLRPFFVDRTDGVADAIYGGDLLGNVWRLDLTAADTTTGLYPAPTRVAQLTDGAATPQAQPITSPVLVEVNPTNGRRYILVGTGRALDSTDLFSPAPQSFYAIEDGTGGAFARLSPSGSWPLTRANLAANTDTRNGVTLSSTQYGWYIDLGTATGDGGSQVGWRVINEAASFAGTLAFAAIVPLGSGCNPSGSSRVYLLNFTSGRSVLADGSAFSTALSGVANQVEVVSVGGQPRVYGRSDTDEENIGSPPQPLSPLRRLNWREVPVTD